jgi:hypothetical protein
VTRNIEGALDHDGAKSHDLEMPSTCSVISVA